MPDPIQSAILAAEYARLEDCKAERDRLREALEQIAQARPTRGVPLKDTLAGCAYIARNALATHSRPEGVRRGDE